MLDEKKAAQGIEAADIGRFLTARDKDNVALFEQLASVLQQALPHLTTVKRYYWGWKLREIIVKFADKGFAITFTRQGVATIVRANFYSSGYVSGDVITMDTMLEELNAKVRQTMAENDNIRDSLGAFVTGANSAKK